MKIIKSKNPFFSAWKKFGWDVNTWGAVIPTNVLKRYAEADETIKFRFRDVNKTFEISAKEAYDFVVNNKSETIIQVPRKAGVIPTSIMKEVNEKRDNSSNN